SKGIAGFRCDMIELVTVDFWKWAIPQIKEQYPGIIFIGEAYQPENYWNYFNIGGFDYLYDKSGFYDTLRRIVRGEDSASSITRQWQQLGDFQPKMLNFLENHDEDRIPSEYFASSPFKALSALFVSLFYNTAPFMIYAGQEFGVGPEKTSIFDFCSLEPLRRWNKGVKESDSQKYLHYEESDLYAIYKAFCDIAVNDPVICKGDTFDLQYANFENGNYNHHRQFSFLRHYEGTVYLCVANFEDRRVDVEINIPQHAFDYYGIQPDETLNPNERIKVSIEKNAGTILRIK
ncbi:MAG: alpha-amylase, partial [Bacteroidales bacterium]|nr:alpha-amylase [Bacteroidales bacterium]